MEKGFFNVILPEDPSSAALVLLYGRIGSGEKVNDSDFVSELMTLAATYKHIDVRINSLGGDVFLGMAIFNALRQIDADINLYIDGVAASMAGVIALCGRPLNMSRYSRLMLHQVSGGIYGTSSEIRQYADVVEGLTGTLVQMVAGRTGMTEDEVRQKWFSGGDHWISAQEALELKLADSIYDLEDADKLASDASAEVIYEFTNRLNFQPLKDINMAIFDELKKRSSFANAATEDQVLAKVIELENDASKVPALEAKVAALESQIETAASAAREAYLAQAVADGRIQDAQKAHFLALMAKDEAGVKALIDSMPKGAGRISDFLGGASSSQSRRDELAKMSWDDLDKAELLGELKASYPELYEAKMKAKFNL